MKTCTKCQARLPLIAFPLVKGKRQAACSWCLNTERRLHDPLKPLRADPLQVRINNVVQLWHGPVRREPMRNIA